MENSTKHLFDYSSIKQSDYLPNPPQSFSTKAIHTAQEPEEKFGCVNVPIYLSTTYAQKGPAQLYDEYDYTRCGNPTRTVLEKCLAALENGKHAIAFSSGCAALTAVTHLFQTGDHFLVCDDVYGGTQRYLRRFSVEKQGFKVDFVDMTSLQEVEKSILETTKLIWIETPTNPLLKLIDIEAIVQLARKQKHQILVVVDNTFATPYLQTPLDHGADLVVHSCTKYIGGHSDLVMGALIFKDSQLYDDLFLAAKSIGGCPSIFDCYLALRSLQTLEVRMKTHTQNAYIIAQFLEKHPFVEQVIYPGLASHPQHQLAQKQMRGYGGMISFLVKGSAKEASTVVQNLKFVTLAESLGGVESLIEIPAVMTHGSVPVEHRKKIGIEDSLIRMSVGIQSIDDLLEDLNRSLELSQQH